MQLPKPQVRDAALSRAFAGKGRIPMSTFVERYIDGSSNRWDLHDFLRARSEWGELPVHWDQAKFLITRFCRRCSPFQGGRQEVRRRPLRSRERLLRSVPRPFDGLHVGGLRTASTSRSSRQSERSAGRDRLR